MSAKCSVTESSEIPESNLPDLSSKFRVFRMDAESTERKLKVANVVIERLKEEITSSRDSEKNLRKQLHSSQNRLIDIQQTIEKLLNAFGQQRHIEKISQQIEEKIGQISEEIKQIREKSQGFLQHVSREIDLLREIKDLKSVMAIKNRECDLMKMEINSLTVENRNMEILNEQKLRDLEVEIKKLKQKEVDYEVNYSETLTYYQQQLEEKEKKIKTYEKERHNFLDNFESLKDTETSSNDFTLADSTVSINAPKRSPKTSSFEHNESLMEPEEAYAQIFKCLPSERKYRITKLKKIKNQSFSKTFNKPQLEFLTPLQLPSQTAKCVTNKGKRSLFSKNCNHYAE